jgi:uncharacterized membrane-anchored protein
MTATTMDHAAAGADRPFTVGAALAEVRDAGHTLDDAAIERELNKPPPPPLAARVVLGIGIWVGAALVAGLAELIDDWLREDGVRLAFGIASLVLAGIISRQERWGDVRVHLAVLFVIVGEGCVITTLPGKDEGILLGLFLLQASIVVLVKNPLTRFTSTGLSVLWLFALSRKLGGGGTSLNAATPDLMVLAVAAAFVGLWLTHGRLVRTTLVGLVQPVGYGLAGGLMGVAALNAMMEAGRGSFDAYLAPPLVAAGHVVLLVIAAVVLARQTARRASRSVPWSILVLFTVVAALLGALTCHMPDLLLAPMLLLIGKARRERALYLLGLVTLVAGLGFTYANVDGSLLFKAAVLFGAGVLLLGARLLVVMVFGASDDAPPVHEPVALSSTGTMAVRAGRFVIDRKRTQAWGKRLAVALAVAMAVGVPLGMAAAKERVKQTGKLVLIPLAPRDPRSIMQGDYMVLRYRFPVDEEKAPGRSWERGNRGPANVSQWPSDGTLRLRLNDQHIVTASTAEAEGEQASTLGVNEARLRYRVRRGQPKIGAESFFFEEGQARTFESARFGGLRVAPSGDAVLVGLYDAEGNAL